MLQRTGNLVFKTFGRRTCYSGLKAATPGGLIKKTIGSSVGKMKGRVQESKIAVPYFSNRELDLDLLKLETIGINNNGLPSILNKSQRPTKLHLGEPDCGEGGPNRPTRGPCDPPEGPCEPMKKPGYPSKPRASREPFCVKCPPKRPCNLNKCPTETEGTCWQLDCQEIAFILCSQSQRSCRLGGMSVRYYCTLRRLKTSRRKFEAPRHQSSKSCDPPAPPKSEKPGACSATKAPDPAVKIVYQKCPAVPKLPRLPECVLPTPTCEIKCPPLPQCPKCPPCPAEDTKKCGKPKNSCGSGEKSTPGIWDKLFGSMKKRKMSTSSGSSDDWKASKCQTVTDICSDKSKEEKEKKASRQCPKHRRTSCYPDVVKCPELELEKIVKKAEAPIDEKIDYSKISCPPLKFVKLEACPKVKINSGVEEFEDEDNSLLMGLPGPPSEPVTLCPCPPPAKLHPGACPCAPEVTNVKDKTNGEPCPPKFNKYTCPEKRVFYCPPQRSGNSQRKNAEK